MPSIAADVSLAGREQEKEKKLRYFSPTGGSARFATKRDATKLPTTTYSKPAVRSFARNVPFLCKKVLWFGPANSRRKPISIIDTDARGECLDASESNPTGIEAYGSLPLSVARAAAERRLRRLQREAAERDVREAYAVGRKRSALLDAARGFVQPRIDYVRERDAFQQHLQQLAQAGRATKPSARPNFPEELWDMLHDRLEGLDHWSGVVVTGNCGNQSSDSGADADADMDEVFPELIDAAFAMTTGTQQVAGTVNSRALRAAVNKFNARAARSRHHRLQIPFKAPLPRTSPNANLLNPPQTIDEAMEMLALAIRVMDIEDGRKTADWEFAVYDLIYGSDQSVDPEVGSSIEIDSDVPEAGSG